MMSSQAEDSSTIGENPYDIDYVVNIIIKEVPKDEKLVKQVLYTILSAKSNEPINLAVNAPTGQGKTYVVQKVANLFPKNDIVNLAGMSEKALFHRDGSYVIKNDNGDYVSIEEQIKEIESKIQDCHAEIDRTKDHDLKQAKKHEIEDLDKEKKEAYKHSKKLIELSGKTLIFLDSPPASLLEALMPLLSHDRNEVEYEYVDTYNGIRTHGNVISGFPAVIFTAAKDYTNNPRYQEIQRRFIITNPEMSQEKYQKAIGCITAKYSLPDFAYQHEVVSDQEKEKAKDIIINILNKITEICSHSQKRDHNQVFIPYSKALEACLPYSDASYMTAAKTMFIWINLLATIHPRPSIQVWYDKIYVQTIPLATFDDLMEAMSLIEYNNGVRPYQLKWYKEVFLPAYESKNGLPDSKGSLTENRPAVITRYLIEKTTEIQNKRLSNKEMLETYLNPLLNLNLISSEPSVLDKRANIYYPVKSNNENKNLFDFANSNNNSQHFQFRIENPAIYPDELYVMNEIYRVLNYSSDIRDKLVDHNGMEQSIHGIVYRYYANFRNCFSNNGGSTPSHASNHNSISYDLLLTDRISREYYQNYQNDERSYIYRTVGSKNAIAKSEQSIKLFDTEQSNNFLFACSKDPKSESNHMGHAVEQDKFSNMENTGVTADMIDKLLVEDRCLPYRSPGLHILDESPLKSIIKQDDSQFYYCTLHPDKISIHLENIEYHIIHSDPLSHKEEIKRILGTKE